MGAFIVIDRVSNLTLAAKNPDIRVDTTGTTPEFLTEHIVCFLFDCGYLNAPEYEI